MLIPGYPHVIDATALPLGATIIHRASDVKMAFLAVNTTVNAIQITARYYNPVTGYFLTDSFYANEFDNDQAA